MARGRTDAARAARVEEHKAAQRGVERDEKTIL